MISREETIVIDLLRQRETELVNVWKCEEGIRAILGLDEFPYPAVPDLPSRRKTQKGAGSRVPVRPKGTDEKRGTIEARKGVALPFLRALRGEETAYRLVFEANGRLESSFQKDLDIVKKLFHAQYRDFNMKRVEAVSFRNLEEWDVKEILWTSESNEGKMA